VTAKLYYGRPPAGDAFSLRDVDFSTYQVVRTARSMYPAEYPVLDYFDIRLGALATTLKSVDGKITELEMAAQMYLRAVQQGGQDVFIIFCADGSAYLAQANALYSAQTAEAVPQLRGDPILIFDDLHAWYPLFRRDDREASAALKRIVARYATVQPVPALSSAEQAMLDRLIAATTLGSPESLLWARAAALAPGPRMASSLPADLREQLANPEAAIATPWRLRMKRSNVLSPLAAYLGAIAGARPDRAGIAALSAEYLRWAAAPHQGYAHGHAWMCGLSEGDLEHSYRTHGGHCITQTANLAAVLTLAGMDYYWLAGVAELGPATYYQHDFIYIPSLDLIVSNGRPGTQLGKTAGTVIDIHKSGQPIRSITFLEHDHRWSGDYDLQRRYRGTMAPREVLEALQFLRGIHGDDLQAASLPGSSPGDGTTLPKLFPWALFRDYLLAQQSGWRTTELP
jgi:hypothetical protein